MKKVLSVLLAVVMLFAVCVPAFAADLAANGASGDVIVKTKTTKIDEGGNEVDARSFTVTIPADTEIDWGTLATDLVYTVESHLGDMEFVNVTVNGNDKMVYEASKTYELPYTLTGATAFTADSPVMYPAADQTITVNVAELDWNTAVVGAYADTLTFTAAIV